MLKYLLVPAFFLAYPGLVSAQYDLVLNNPDIIWAAEVQLDFDLENLEVADSLRSSEVFLLKKQLSDGTTIYPDDLLLGKKIFDAVQSGRLRVFENFYSREPLSKEAASAKLIDFDTVTTIDLATGLDRRVPIENEYGPASVGKIRVRQLLYYDQKRGEFDVHTLAYAPLIQVFSYFNVWQTGYSEQFLAWEFIPFWIKMPPFSKKEHQSRPKMREPDVSLAFRMKKTLRIDSLFCRKDFRPPVMQQLLDRARFDDKFVVKDADNSVLAFSRRQAMFVQTDTTVSFDPETYEELILINKKEFDAGDFPQIRLLEDWFWDDRKQQLSIKLHAAAPILGVHDSNGNFRYDWPFFWREKR